MIIDTYDIPSTSSETTSLSDKGIQTDQDIDGKTSLLRRKIKTLKQKVKRKNVKIENMTQLIKEIKNSGQSNEPLLTVLENYFEGRYFDKK